MSFALRPYQEECLQTIFDRYRAGVRRQLVCLPTGTGKTVVFARFPEFFRMKNRMLVIAHREELLEQARAKFMTANPELEVGIEQAGRSAPAGCRVVLGSAATLGRSGSGRLTRFDPDEFHLVVIDEAHHAAAPTYARILKHFGFANSETRKLLVGFTATPKRGDGVGLDSVFDEISYSRPLIAMIHAGFLTPIVGYRVETDIDLSNVRTSRGDFVLGQLGRTVNVSPRNELVVRIFQERLADRTTLVFCVNVAHARDLAECFRAHGIEAAAIYGEMAQDDRIRALAGFREGRLRVLTNCMVLSEGYDEPSVEGVILARPTKSTVLYTQMIGRGTRIHPGKDRLTVVDIVDVTKQHRLATLPALFGFPPGFDLKGRSVAEAEEAARWVAENRPWVPIEAATNLDELRLRCRRVDLLDLRPPPELAGLSRFAWFAAGSGAFRIAFGGGESVALTRTLLGAYEVELCNLGTKVKSLGSGLDLGRAVAVADRFIESERPDAVSLVNLRAPWRRESASEKQLAYIQRMGLEVPGDIRRGQASHLIAMLPRATKAIDR